MPLYTPVYMCLAVTYWERADLLALVCAFLIQLRCGHDFRQKVRTIDRWMDERIVRQKANIPKTQDIFVFKKTILCTLGRSLK